MRNFVSYGVSTQVPKTRATTGKKRHLKTGNSSSLYPVPTHSEPPARHNRVAIRLAHLLRGTIGI
jgi:hypothetical protein